MEECKCERHEINVMLKKEFDMIHEKIVELLGSENMDCDELRRMVETQIRLANKIERGSVSCGESGY